MDTFYNEFGTVDAQVPAAFRTLRADPNVQNTGELPDLNERSQHLLRVLVELYIQDGEPVGSRTLARAGGLELSPATIRNVMSDLEDLGLVGSPHTSAGRIPTVLGYRVFIERLLPPRRAASSALREIRNGLDPDRDSGTLVNQASTLLSGVTRLAALVTVPRQEVLTLRQVAFLPLSERRVLAVLVLNEREVQNRVLHTARDYSAAELERVGSYLNTEFNGRNLNDIRRHLVNDMDAVRDGLNSLMTAAIEVGGQAFEQPAQDADFVLTGEQNLIGCHELDNRDSMQRLFEAFNHKHDILQLLDQCLDSHDGVRVFIGEEAGYRPLEACSLVTAPYTSGETNGVIGVIGPTRMYYEQVIPLVTATARLLGSALKHH